MLLLLQIGVVLAVSLYLGQRYLYLHRRNHTSWETLLKQLDRWPSDLKTPWSRFQRARVLLEIADYAAINSIQLQDFFDLTPVAVIRKDAMEVRVSALADMMAFA